MSELILRGHCPYRPAVDDKGVDLVLSNGVRLQVKTARLHKRKHHAAPAYNLTLGWTKLGRVQSPIRRPRRYSEECDFLVIFGVDENRFWIVPSYLVDGKHCLQLGPKNWVTKSEVDSLLGSSGVTGAASALNVSRTTVWRRKQGDLKRGGFVRAVRMCEDKWEFLNSPSETHQDNLNAAVATAAV